MIPFVDPRVRMRSALQQLVQAEPTTWHEPTLTIFRNRLLDATGSDARPLAELLLEAMHRGWRDRLPGQRVEPSRWDAMAAPFVMQWSAERFIQPEMAQWAVESWALAFGVIAPEQLRIAPEPQRVAPSARTDTRDGDQATKRGTASPTNTRAPIAAPPSRASGRSASRNAASAARASAGALASRPWTGGNATRSAGRASALPMLNPRIVWGLAAAAALSYVGFIGRIAWAIRENKRAAAVSTAEAPPAAPTSATSPAPTIVASAPTVTAGANSGTIEPRVIVDPRRDTVAVPAPVSTTANPGVPSVTRSLLDANLGDRSRMMYVEPARRAQGSSRTTATVPNTSSPLAFDEVFLNDGTSMRGRVDVVRAGEVIFRDMRTGLRHELRKDDIDRIITEFGAPVRFRVAGTPPVRAADAKGAGIGATSTRAAARARDTGPRGRGVAGVYTIRYAAAVAQGSPECTEVWRRPPNAVDRATVRHTPGADTLTVVFDGGDSFLSNVDGEGYFASTFRIVPDQARSSTALTTRLTGQFLNDGALALQVSIVFFRRMRTGADLACTVTVNADGQRVSAP